MSLFDSYVESNQNTTDFLYALPGYQGAGQSFTASNSNYLVRAKFYLRKGGSPTGTMTAKLYAHSGTYGTSSVPTGSALATSNTLDVSTLTTSLALIQFTFDTPYLMTSSTKYVLTINYSGGDSSNYVEFGIDSSSPSHAGNSSLLYSGSWSSAANDLIFYAYDDYDSAASKLTDNFNDNTIDTAKWDNYVVGAATIDETNNQLEITPPTMTSGVNEAGYISDEYYTLVGTEAFVEVKQTTNNLSTCYTKFHLFNELNYLGFSKYSNTLYLRAYSGSLNYSWQTMLTYDSTNHRYWRVRESGGTLYWDTSADGITWTNRKSLATPYSLRSMQVRLIAGAESSSSPGYAIFDNVNIRTFDGELSLIGASSTTLDGVANFTDEISWQGNASITANGLQQTTIQNLPKIYQYKVYDENDTYLGIWNDVISQLNFSREINSAGSSVEVELARNSDTKFVSLQDLETTAGVIVEAQDGLDITVSPDSPNNIGPGSDVDLNYFVDIYVFYGYESLLGTEDDDELTTEADETMYAQYGAPNGRKIFNGFISRYVSKYGDTETTSVTLLSIGDELNNYVIEDAGVTKVPFLSQDPSDIAKGVLDLYNSESGSITYTDASIQLTATKVSYTFNVNTVLEGINKTLELAPADWFWYLDMGTNLIYFLPRPSSTAHTFVLGKHIQSLNLEKNIENMVNTVYFTGGESSPGVNLYSKYTDDDSITGWRKATKVLSDGRVTTQESMDILAQGELDRGSEPQYRSQLVILDSVYPIEDIELGQLIGFRNFDNFIDDLTMQIVGISYEPDRIQLQLDTLLPRVSKRLEDIKRNLVAQEIANNPDTPT